MNIFAIIVLSLNSVMKGCSDWWKRRQMFICLPRFYMCEVKNLTIR